ncbi:MAG: DUF4190 domain-containing protein [Hamadaea sp.]|uniref:DUF4190 domain-containing protein n=1 Tax=Hamadaea sp. TaxID=2024425 RepID=UPI001849952F|nr:DUF4190 domain-containing protein [Hamadaea sp.]NUR71259.1 DUF4190 domain-containing protein [Hamadaea sp.]NUT23137.1 DUF4190 domain-containing protein [Hamadaea sp.]
MTEPTPAEGQPPATGYVVPPGYGTPYVLPYAPARKTNGLAVASLVTSIVALNFCFPATIVGAIMGHIARRRIKETGEDGEGLALGGIVVGWIGFGITVAAIALIIILAASGAFDGPSRPDIVY